MRKTWILACSVALSVAAAGCSLPTPNYIGEKGSAESHVTLDDLMRHIRCEIENGYGFSDLAKANYGVQITLALKVEDTGGIAPDLGYITNHAAFTYLLDGNLSLDRQQTYNASYTMDLKQLAAHMDAQKDCADARDGSAVTHTLSGDLGIDDVMRGGKAEIDNKIYNVSASNLPNFGSTVQFQITKGFDTGPYWKITHFTGPSGSSKGLVSGSSVTTDNLIIAFSPVTAQPSNKDLEEALKEFDKAVADLKASLTPTRNHNYVFSLKALDAQKRIVDAQQKISTAVANQSQSAPATTGLQSFTTNIILQNLAGSLQATPH